MLAFERYNYVLFVTAQLIGKVGELLVRFEADQDLGGPFLSSSHFAVLRAVPPNVRTNILAQGSSCDHACVSPTVSDNQRFTTFVRTFLTV